MWFAVYQIYFSGVAESERFILKSKIGITDFQFLSSPFISLHLETHTHRQWRQFGEYVRVLCSVTEMELSRLSLGFLSCTRIFGG